MRKTSQFLSLTLSLFLSLTLFLFLSLSLTLTLPSPARAEPLDKPTARQTALTARMTLKVVHPVQARAALLAEAAQAGGFPTLVSDPQVRLKVPPQKLADVLAKVGADGIVLDKTIERVDLTEEIAQLEAHARSKLDILERLRRFFDDSNVQATLEIERNMTSLVAELESVKGRLRVARERAQWAVVEVSFQFQERDRITYVRSPFAWLNGVDLDRFLQEY